MATNHQEPILAGWRVSEVLRRYPALLETLVGLNPAFAHLRNPIVRKVQSRLVTVAQAARIAGMEPAALVRALNAAAGLASAPEPARAPDGAPVAAGSGGTLVDAEFERAPIPADLDVRPLLARGEEPFRAIMAAVAAVGAGRALRLRAGFEPAPLYDVLARRGFAHRARQLGPEDWEVLFLKTGAADAGPAGAAGRAARPAAVDGSGSAAGNIAPDPAVAATLTIDVSDLAPPEPMVRILEACEQLAPGQTLLVEHARRPVFLYPRLEELGYTHETRELGPGRVELRIRKPAAGGADQ